MLEITPREAQVQFAPRQEGGRHIAIQAAAGLIIHIPLNEDELADWRRWINMSDEELIEALDRLAASARILRATEMPDGSSPNGTG